MRSGHVKVQTAASIMEFKLIELNACGFHLGPEVRSFGSGKPYNVQPMTGDMIGVGDASHSRIMLGTALRACDLSVRVKLSH